MNARCLGVQIGLLAALMPPLAPINAQPQSRVGPYAYTGSRCAGYSGPFETESEAAAVTLAANYSKDKCWYRLDGPLGPWGEPTLICGAQDGGSASRSGLEYWAVRRYRVTYSALAWDSYKEIWTCTAPLTDGLYVFRERVVCSLGQIYYQPLNRCVNLKERDRLHLNHCPTRSPNPAVVITASREYSVNTGLGWPDLPFVLRYDSSPRPVVGSALPPPLSGRPDLLGPMWSSSLHRLLVRLGSDGVIVGRQDGGKSIFNTPSNWTFVPDAQEENELVTLQQGYGFRDKRAARFELFDIGQRLVEVQPIDGPKLVLSYSSTANSQAPGPGFLLSIADAFGRRLDFHYRKLWDGDPADFAVLSTVSTDDGRSVTLDYDAARRLSSVSFPDGSREQFFYEDARHPWALTRRRNALGVDVGHYTYGESGHVQTSAGANGINRYALAHESPPGRTTTEEYDAATNTLYRTHEWSWPRRVTLRDPLGGELQLDTAKESGFLRETGKTQPAGSGCAAATSRQAVDAHGNLLWRDDFQGQRSCHAHDPARRLELTRVEGLAAGAGCEALQAQAALPAGSRKLSRQWHPVWHLTTRLAEPGQITTRVYNGQPDPLAGNAVASCAPATARLADGSPIVVLCKEAVQATTDIDGRLGFSATPDLKSPPRVQTWTYNQLGQVLTHKGPRTDVDATTRYEYHASTGADFRVGDLKLVRNALGQLTQYPRYDRAGRVLESVDANGVVTRYGYDLRHRLVSRTTADASWRYDYLANGLLERITEPDGSYLAMRYDEAERLIGVADGNGNRIDYVLDAAGHRIEERATDPGGQLRRMALRQFDALGRLSQLTGRP